MLPICDVERYLYLNPESYRSKQARYQLSYLLPLSRDEFFVWLFKNPNRIFCTMSINGFSKFWLPFKIKYEVSAGFYENIINYEKSLPKSTNYKKTLLKPL